MNKLTVLAAALALALPTAFAHPLRGVELHDALEQEKAVTNIYRAYFPNAELGRKAAITFHANLLESDTKRGFLVLELDAEELDKLRRFAFRFELAADFIERRNQRLSGLQADNLRAGKQATVEPRSIPGYTCYETVEETFSAADGLITAKPLLAQWADAGDSWLKTQGSGGYDMRVLKLTNSAVSPPAGTDKPRLFITSAIHAREYTTAPMALEFARWLVNGHGSNADATWILDHHEVHLLLHTNPDGRKRAEAGLSWRKNVNNNFCANTNTRGVDLNRNFTFSWNTTAGQGSSGAACNLTYRGPSAASEPEVQAVQNYARQLWPDRRGPGAGDAAPSDTSGIHIDLHSYSELVLWPWGDTNAPAPNGTALQTLGRKFAFFNGYTPTQSIGLYPTDGTSDGPSYGELGVAAFTFEMGTSFFQSCTDYENTIKPANLPALIYAAKVVRSPYVTPAGPDVTALALGTDNVPAGTPVPITATISDARFNNSNGVEATQAINAAQISIDVPPWQAGAPVQALGAADGSFDSVTEGVAGSINTAGLAPGRHIVYVRGRDASGAWGAVSAVFLNIASGPLVVAEQEPNDTLLQAQAVIALPAQVNGSIAVTAGDPRDTDYYAVTVQPGRTLTAQLVPSIDSTFSLNIYSATEALLSHGTRGLGRVEVATATNTSSVPVTMVVRVFFARFNRGTGFGTYRIDLSE